MAARRSKATVSEDSAAEQVPATGGLTLAVRASSGVRRAERERKDDETYNAVRDALSMTLTEGAKAFDVATEEESKKVVSLLQRAATELAVGLKKSVSVDGGVWTVDFEGNPVKRARKYTAKDIVAWYGQNFATDAGPAELTGPIPAEVREAYRIANGYQKGTTTLYGATFTSE